MRGRFLALTLAVTAVLASAARAEAHRLDAASRVLPGRMVRIETWFDNGDLPKSGQVEVFGDGELIVKGRLSSQGLFLFDAPKDAPPLRVVIDAGGGHGKNLEIGPEQFAAVETPAQAVPQANGPAPDRHESTFPVKDVLLGIGLLLGAAAFVLSLRNARRIRELRPPS
jgi:hypothetical protein